MKKLSLVMMLVIILMAGCAEVPKPTIPVEVSEGIAPEIPREMRGVWIARMSWARPDPLEMKERIINTMARAAQANCNAVFFQVRGQAETLYPSPYEPWSKLVGAKDPGFDPVKLAVDEAHKHGLAFHAYINFLPMWNEQKPPQPPDHLYYKHGPTVAPEDSWILFGTDGKTMNMSEYYYMNPALPEVKTYLKKVIRHFVTAYDVDGIHFDRIRYPGPDYINDPYSLDQYRRANARSPLAKAEWARRTLTDLVEDVVADAKLLKPYLQVSMAAWGMYRTDDITVRGYENFGSGYANYYQDSIGWLDRGIMDFLVPMIYWDIPDPKPNFDDLWLDFKRRTPNYKNIFPGMRVGGGLIQNGEIARQVNFVRQNGGRGTVIWSFSALQNEQNLEKIKKDLYPHKAPLPANLNRTTPQQIATFKLTDEKGNPLTAQNFSLTSDSHTKTTDTEGWLGLILPEPINNLELKKKELTYRINARGWRDPYRYVVKPDGTAEREKLWLEFRRLPTATTNQPEFAVLCKTDHPHEAFINDQPLKVYETGIFFDRLNFKEGANNIKAQVIDPATSDSVVYFRRINYEIPQPTPPRQPFPLWIDQQSIQPTQIQTWLPDDTVRINFNGSKGQQAFAQIQPADIKYPLSRQDFDDYSLYQADLPLRLLQNNTEHNISLILESTSDGKPNQKIEQPIEATIKVLELDQFPLVRVNRPNTIMTYNLGEIRLGGPIIAEYQPGVILQTSGQIGNNYRIHLNQIDTGFISQNSVDLLPPGQVKPSYYVSSMDIRPGPDADLVGIPYPEPVPYAVYPDPDQNCIKINLYGVKTSSTWITHRHGRKIIDKVTWRQVTPDTYQVIVNLKSRKIWGYQIEQTDGSLRLRVKHPPQLNGADSDQPLQGLKIAIEAGHGGRGAGAVGPSGLQEKEVNLAVSLELEKICKAHGLEVLQIRPADIDMSLTEKWNKAHDWDADLLVSIHANAGGSRGGYLGVSGVSTYYHNPFWAKFAQIAYKHLLQLPLEEFGTVGSFNYKVIRMSARPAILVEQAFMSHAGDEEKLANPQFRRQMAQKIFDGIVEYVDYMLHNTP